jgi:uncharacterized protein (TIGR02246 family)
MDESAVRAWVDRYREAWESNDPDTIGGLFADGARYHTEPYAEPIAGRDAIVADWLERKDEPGQTSFRSEVLAIAGDVAFVRGWTTYFDPPQRDYSNLWVIRFDGDGRCEEFTEWWMKHRATQGSGSGSGSNSGSGSG